MTWELFFHFLPRKFRICKNQSKAETKRQKNSHTKPNETKKKKQKQKNKKNENQQNKTEQKQRQAHENAVAILKQRILITHIFIPGRFQTKGQSVNALLKTLHTFKISAPLSSCTTPYSA